MRSAARLVIALVAASGAALSSPARAQAPACKAPFERAQELRKDGRLIAARRELTSCVAACPAALAEQCRIWIGEVEPQMSWLTVIVTDSKGRSRGDALVELDGDAVPRRVWQGAIPVDPGRRVVRVSLGEVVKEQSVDIAAGAAERVTIIPGGEGESTQSSEDGVPAHWFVLGGGGLAVALAGMEVVIAGHVLASDYKARCEERDPECSLAGSAEWRSDVRKLWTAGGIVGGVGAAALGAAIVGAVIEASGGPAAPASSLRVVPHPGGLGLGLRF
jgi:hypothetical protein